MNFAPPPANDFAQFIGTYFQRCREAFPRILAIAGKWTQEDLIPGLSDFDTRFILTDGMVADDWREMSLAVGRVHTELARQVPRWARNLEHLPGLNLTLSEITNPAFYYPEFQQWSFYHGDESALGKIRSYLASRAWSPRDELFHLKKIATYIGPYQRGIDPPVNIGPWENKYALHSRFMHYFTPPVQSMVSLAARGGCCGKLLALGSAKQLLPMPGTISMLLDAVTRHYEIESYYVEPELSRIERELESYLMQAWQSLHGRITLVRVEAGDTPHAIRGKVAALPVDPIESFFEGVKFCRLMEGRLLFYAEPIDWFDSSWLIRNELGRIVANFHDKPLRIYAQARFGQSLPPAQVLERLSGELLSADECKGMSDFAAVAGRPIETCQEKQRAAQVAGVYAPVLLVLEKLGADLLARQAVSAATSD